MTEENKSVFEEMPEDELMPPQKSSMIAGSKAGEIYDWQTAPDYVKSAPRIDLNGKTVVIEKVEIILPRKEEPWTKSMKGTTEMKRCQFKIFYEGGQSEFASGLSVFKKEGDMYSHPTVYKDGQNQVAKLFGLYAKFKGRKPEEVSLKEFLAFLNSKPKARIVAEPCKNPKTGDVVMKNMVGEFVN